MLAVDRKPFKAIQPGSFYSLGPIHAAYYIIMLHGNGRNAEWMYRHAYDMSQKHPQAEIIVPNGSYKYESQSHFEKEKNKSFSWGYYDYRPEFQKCFNDIFNTINIKKPIHLFGFSAGGFAAYQEFADRSHFYDSLTLQGYHLKSDLTQSVCEMAQNKELLTNIPIQIIMPVWDPLLAFNFHAGLSKAFENLNLPNFIKKFGNRHEAFLEHIESIKKLRRTGFRVEVTNPILSTHNITPETRDTFDKFIRHNIATLRPSPSELNREIG